MPFFVLNEQASLAAIEYNSSVQIDLIRAKEAISHSLGKLNAQTVFAESGILGGCMHIVTRPGYYEDDAFSENHRLQLFLMHFIFKWKGGVGSGRTCASWLCVSVIKEHSLQSLPLCVSLPPSHLGQLLPPPPAALFISITICVSRVVM